MPTLKYWDIGSAAYLPVPLGGASAPLPIGGIIMWGSDTLPSSAYNMTFLFLHGQTVIGGSGQYFALATLYPSWVSGGNLILPDTRKMFIQGADIAGGGANVFATGGTANITLTTAMIPQFASVPLTMSNPSHNHTINISDPSHFHAAQPGFAVVVQTSSSQNLQAAGTGTQVSSNIGNPNTDSKATNVTATAVATTTAISGTVTFGSASPTPVPNVPPFLNLHYIVRAA
jgi:hypothetical protein